MSAGSRAVGIISQSDALCEVLRRLAPARGLRFSRVMSLRDEGGALSLDSVQGLARDPLTGVIGLCLAEIEEDPHFPRGLRAACLEKPVVLWAGGLSSGGGEALHLQAGAIARDPRIRQGALRQTGATSVQGWEQWMDALVSFALLPAGLGDRMAIISGPGGLAVAAAEACGREGLRLAEISAHTIEKLAAIVPPTGTSLRNPIDVGLSAFLQTGMYRETAWAVASDPGVDAVMVIGRGASREANEQFTEGLIRTREELGKPLLIVNIPGFDRDLARGFCEAGVPFFESAERAVRAYGLVRHYQAWRSARP